MLNDDYKDMLLALSDEKVKYLLVGAYALAAHGYPRATMDIDIWIMPSPQNADAVMRALHRFDTFEIENAEKDYLKKGYLVIPAKSKTKVAVVLLPTNIARKYLEQGHMDISLYFSGENINQFSPNVPFSKSYIEGYCIPIEIKEIKS